MKTKDSNLKATLASGTSSAIGATIGVVAGSAILSSAQAADNVEMEAEPVENSTHSSAVHTVADSQPAPVADSTVHTSEQLPPEPPVSEQPEDTDVEVMSYETVTTEDGTSMDIAVVAVDGQLSVVADVDADGYADVIGTDLNNSGQLDTDEMVGLPEHSLAMQPFQDAANVAEQVNVPTTDDYTDTNDYANTGDYVNNANVEEYMA